MAVTWMGDRFGRRRALLALAGAGGADRRFVLRRARAQRPVAPRRGLAGRIGLVNTMVFTHIPSSLLLASVAFAPNFPVAAVLFLLRESLVEMDVPTRQSYVMAVQPVLQFQPQGGIPFITTRRLKNSVSESSRRVAARGWRSPPRRSFNRPWRQGDGSCHRTDSAAPHPAR
jgi:hypothetical protein